MSWYETAYLTPPDDSPEVNFENVVVRGRVHDAHDEDYNPVELFPLLLEVARGDDDKVYDLVRALREDYRVKLSQYVDDNYEAAYWAWCSEQ